MSIWVTLKMTVRNDAYANLRLFLDEKLPAVRGFDGSLSVSILFDEETNKLLIVEEWKSRKHHQAYITKISDNGVMEQLLSFMISPPEIQNYERVVI